jgi:hypothetical protein
MFDICGVGAVFRFSVSGKADEQKKKKKSAFVFSKVVAMQIIML